MPIDWDEYYRRLQVRDDRRSWLRRRAGFTDHPGEAHFHRSNWQVMHPGFGGQVAPAPVTRTGYRR